MAAKNGLERRRRLKVLFVLDSFPDPHAGTEGQFWMLLNSLDRSRFEPAILLLRPSEFLSRNAGHVPLRVLNITTLRSPRALGRLCAAAAWARREGFRVAHIFFNDSAIAFPLPLRMAGLSVIVSRRDLGFWYTRSNLPLLRLNGRFIAAAIANSNAVKRVVHQKEKIVSSKIHVIYNGIIRTQSTDDRSIRADLHLPQHARLIVVVANLRPLKRNSDAIRALARLPAAAADAHLVLVGEDREGSGPSSHRHELETLAHEIGVAGRVHFTGKLTDPMPVIAQATLCMLCSETEGLSNAIIEYMVAGKPVVCTDVGGNPELVIDGHNGYIVPMGDVSRLTNRMAALLESPSLCEQLGGNSRVRAQAMFSANASCQAHEQLYLAVSSTTSASVWAA